jgi:hypothetical protein
VFEQKLVFFAVSVTEQGIKQTFDFHLQLKNLSRLSCRPYAKLGHFSYSSLLTLERATQLLEKLFILLI